MHGKSSLPTKIIYVLSPNVDKWFAFRRITILANWTQIVTLLESQLFELPSLRTNCQFSPLESEVYGTLSSQGVPHSSLILWFAFSTFCALT